MRTRTERRKFKIKEIFRRFETCVNTYVFKRDDKEALDIVKHKSDIPHSLGSNYWNAYETKSMKNKKDRLDSRNKLKKEMENFE